MPHSEMLNARLELLGIDRAVIAELHGVKRIVEPSMDQMMDQFYLFIRSAADLQALFPDEDSMDSARSAQARHWSTLFDARFDGDYFESTVKIGQAHARIGLTLDKYLAGYNQMFGLFVDVVLAECEKNGESPGPKLRALEKAIFLDMDLVIHCYLDGKDSTMRHILARATDLRSDIWKVSDELGEVAAGVNTAAASLLDGVQSSAAAAPGLNRSVYDLVALGEKLSRISTRLDSRLRSLPLSDKLYLEENDDRANAFSRLISLVLAKPQL